MPLAGIHFMPLTGCEADLEESSLESGEGHTNLEIQLLPSIHRQSLIAVGLSKLILETSKVVSLLMPISRVVLAVGMGPLQVWHE